MKFYCNFIDHKALKEVTQPPTRVQYFHLDSSYVSQDQVRQLDLNRGLNMISFGKLAAASSLSKPHLDNVCSSHVVKYHILTALKIVLHETG